jgi:aryl-alcohol dehydrogenase-like predicted oxidoreductase
MRTERLGRSGLAASAICHRTSDLDGDRGVVDPESAVTALRTTRHPGINFSSTPR